MFHPVLLRQHAYRISITRPRLVSKAPLHSSPQVNRQRPQETHDPRISEVDGDLIIEDDFAVLKPRYQAPKHPIILAHGLLGFDEIRPLGANTRGIEYWYGIKQALAAKGIEVITASVPPSETIEVRAQRLAEDIAEQAGGKAVNIIAYVFVFWLRSGL
jgi:hypothetical protein